MVKNNLHIDLRKVKLSEGYLEIEYEEVFEDEQKQLWRTSFVRKGGPLAHADLVNAMARLTFHLVALSEQLASFQLLDKYESEGLKNFCATGVTFGGDGDYEGATIVGQKKLRKGKVLNLVAPFTVFTDLGEEPYEHEEDFVQDLITLRGEVYNYILSGKCQPAAQLSIEFEAEDTPDDLLKNLNLS